MTMGHRTDLTKDEKRIIVKELANATTPEMIASKINRHVVTVNKFVNDPLKKRKSALIAVPGSLFQSET